MSEENFFIPNILICGDRAEFLARVNQRPFKIVGQISFSGTIEGREFNFFKEGNFSINGKIYNHSEFIKILRGGMANFIVFNNLRQYYMYFDILIKNGATFSQLLTPEQLNTLPYDNFYDYDADVQLLIILKTVKFKTLLDFDAHFLKSPLLSKGVNDFTEIDCISEKDFLPIKNNFYRCVYKKFSECRLKNYSAVLLEEKSPETFNAALERVKNSSDLIISFAKYGSELLNYLQSITQNFKKIDGLNTSGGIWIFCYLHKPPEDFANYVVTHKKISSALAENLPEGYKLIHAGRALSEDLGYIGDNTGDNISHLNPYINEITALYWMWKNTSHTVIGLSHYRRFFTDSNSVDFAPEKILTKEAALKILEDYDIAVNIHFGGTLQFEAIVIDCGYEIFKIAEQIFIRNLEKFQPEFVDSFNFVMNTKVFYRCQMFITRRNVFDAYCNWFFSFFINSVNEVCMAIPLNTLKGKPKRLLGFFAERMLTVWLMKQNLRIKELEIMKVPN